MVYIIDGMGLQKSESALCSNGCGFFGTAATMGLCSKCYSDLQIDEERKASAKTAVEKLDGTESPKNSVPDCGIGPSRSTAEHAMECEKVEVRNRCSSCNKKVGNGMLGFRCKCGGTFCGVHRYAEKHNCTFDYKGVGRENISEANPVIKKDKMERI